MTDNEQKIKCPQCGESISIDDVLTNQIEEKIRKDFEAAQKVKEQELELRAEELKRPSSEIERSKKAVDSVVAEKVAEQIAGEKLKLFREARAQIEKEKNEEKTFLEEQLKDKDAKLA